MSAAEKLEPSSATELIVHEHEHGRKLAVVRGARKVFGRRTGVREVKQARNETRKAKR